MQVQFPALSVGSVYAAAAANQPFEVAWTNSLGHALIREVSVEVGGQKIDRQYGEWLEVWDELSQTSEKQNGYNHMVGKYAASLGLSQNANTSRIYYVPLMFWFCRNPGLSLPLIALTLAQKSIQLQVCGLSFTHYERSSLLVDNPVRIPQLSIIC